MKLFVANLPLDLDRDELQEIFSEYGPVIQANIVKNRYTHKSRGFGFVEFGDAQHTAEAIKALNGGSIDENTIIVKRAERVK